MIQDLFSATVLIGILASGIRLATPYLFASIGEMFGQRSGVLNLGVEGQMLLGAFAAFYIGFTTGNLWLGIGAAMLVGALMGLAMAFVTVNLHAEQGISGIGFYLFGLGMSDLLFQKMLGSVETVKGFSAVHIPFLSDIPILGPIFFQQNIIVYLAYALVPIAFFVLYKTNLGLKIRSVGENPQAAELAGCKRGRHSLFYDDSGWDPVGHCRGIPFHCPAQCLSAEYDQRSRVHCRGSGLLRRLAPVWNSVRCAALQHGQCAPALDPGAADPHPIRFCCHDAICADDPGACRCGSAGAPAIRTVKAVRT